MTTDTHGIALRIRDDIIEGTLQFGGRVTIDALATRYGVSHMPVREALRELRGEGLVVIEPNRGARVRTVDVSFVENLFETRTAIEVMMVRRAAARCTPHDIAEIRAIEQVLEQHIASGDHASVVAENQRQFAANPNWSFDLADISQVRGTELAACRLSGWEYIELPRP